MSFLSSIVSAYIGSKASKKASTAQAKAAKEALQLQERMYEQTRSDLAPWRTVGASALNQYAQLFGVPTSQTTTYGAPAYGGLGFQGDRITRGLGNITGYTLPSQAQADTAGAGQQPTQDLRGFYASPGYQFRLGEGINALEKSAAGRGLLKSGSFARGAMELGQGMASQEFNQYANRLASLAGIGQSTATQLGQFGAQSAGQQGMYLQNMGTARASGYLGNAGAWQQGIADINQMAGMGLGYGLGYGGIG